MSGFVDSTQAPPSHDSSIHEDRIVDAVRRRNGYAQPSEVYQVPSLLNKNQITNESPTMNIGNIYSSQRQHDVAVPGLHDPVMDVPWSFLAPPEPNSKESFGFDNSASGETQFSQCHRALKFSLLDELYSDDLSPIPGLAFGYGEVNELSFPQHPFRTSALLCGPREGIPVLASESHQQDQQGNSQPVGIWEAAPPIDSTISEVSSVHFDIPSDMEGCASRKLQGYDYWPGELSRSPSSSVSTLIYDLPEDQMPRCTSAMYRVEADVLKPPFERQVSEGNPYPPVYPSKSRIQPFAGEMLKVPTYYSAHKTTIAQDSIHPANPGYVDRGRYLMNDHFTPSTPLPDFDTGNVQIPAAWSVARTNQSAVPAIPTVPVKRPRSGPECRSESDSPPYDSVVYQSRGYVPMSPRNVPMTFTFGDINVPALAYPSLLPLNVDSRSWSMNMNHLKSAVAKPSNPVSSPPRHTPAKARGVKARECVNAELEGWLSQLPPISGDRCPPSLSRKLNPRSLGTSDGSSSRRRLWGSEDYRNHCRATNPQASGRQGRHGHLLPASRGATKRNSEADSESPPDKRQRV